MRPGRERTPAATGVRGTSQRNNYARAYPGARRPLWDVLSAIRRRHWWHAPELKREEAQQVWVAFAGEDTLSEALGRLVYELHEHGRLQRVDIERRSR